MPSTTTVSSLSAITRSFQTAFGMRPGYAPPVARAIACRALLTVHAPGRRADRPIREDKKQRQGGDSLLATLNIYRTGGLATRPGSYRRLAEFLFLEWELHD
ncbi:hypothetical protein GCM10017556_36280 [Micromonospora sagamiensis]|nr:hypothetical protein GCM10017556_36280 [Micromonospora sagamiensis]